MRGSVVSPRQASAPRELIVTYTLRPLTLGELLDRTFSIYRTHFALFLGISALPNLFALIVTLSLPVLQPRGANPWLAAPAMIAMLFVVFAVAAFVQGATVVAVSQIQLGKTSSVAEAFAAVRPMLGRLLRLAMNVGIRITIGFCLLLVPGIIMALMYAFAVPVTVLEHKTVSESISRSAALTKGHRGRIFVIYVLTFVLFATVTALWQVATILVFGPFRAGPPSLMFVIVTQCGNFATGALLGPIATIALAVAYYDERVRKEAFDLEHMMREMDGLPIEPTPAAA
jgi:hypothetical protein